MSELLEYLNITTKRELHDWYLKNHPDKCNDPDASRRFALVKTVWDKLHPVSVQACSNIYIHRHEPHTRNMNICDVLVPMSMNGICNHPCHPNSTRCFYHLSESNMTYKPPDIPSGSFFGPFGVYEYKIYVGRTENMCTEYIGGNMYCTNMCTGETSKCSKHLRFKSV